jgi:hypothetical protein
MEKESVVGDFSNSARREQHCDSKSKKHEWTALVLDRTELEDVLALSFKD